MINPAHPKAPSPEPNRQWPAHLQVQLTKTNRGTRLTRSRHRGPLYVQKPFYPEGADLAHLYLLHPPAGLVSGDTLDIDIALGPEARALVTTPGAARLYKAREQGSWQRQTTHLRLAESTALEWFPMETIIYPGASAEVTTSIQLGDGSAFMGWEITCFGLPASGQPCSRGRYRQSYRIEHNGLPVFIDQLDYAGDNEYFYRGLAGLQSRPVSGFLIAGPFGGDAGHGKGNQDGDQLANALSHAVATVTTDDGPLADDKPLALTWVNDYCVVRYLGNSAFTCRRHFIRLWSLLRPALLHYRAREPGIWAT